MRTEVAIWRRFSPYRRVSPIRLPTPARTYDQALHARASSSPTRRPARAAALHAPPRNAEPRVRAAAAAPGGLEAAPARTAEAGRARLHRARLPARGGPRCRHRAGPLVLARPRLQDPVPRGPRRARRQERNGAGAHDLRLPARVDRTRVRDRRPRDADRLRPRLGGGRPADPPPGHL